MSRPGADIEAILAQTPATPDDIIEDAKWWLHNTGGPLPEAAPVFKALCRVVEENERLRVGGAYCDDCSDPSPPTSDPASERPSPKGTK